MRPNCDCPPDALSPSQIDTYRSCQRKWGFRKLAKQPEPEFGFQVAGKAIHDMLEKYALTGELPERNTKHGKAVWAVVKNLPKPDSRHRCEQHIRVDLNRMVIHGYPDLLPTDVIEVHDYKTVSVQKPPFKFAHNHDTLKTDTQANIYAWVRSNGRAPVVLKWHYIERASPYRVHTVAAVLTYEELADNMSDIWKTAEVMYGHKQAVALVCAFDHYPKPIDYVNEHLAADTTFCGAYGGCPHALYCTAHRATEKKEIAMSFDKIRARMQEIAGGSDEAETVQKMQIDDPINPPVSNKTDDDDDEDEEVALQRKLEETRAKKAAAKAAKEKAEAVAKAKPSPKTTTAPSGLITVSISGSGDTFEAALQVLKSAAVAL